MNIKKALMVIILSAVALMAVAKVASPSGLDQLEHHLAVQGWKKGQLTLLNAGYSSGMFSQNAHGRYASSDPVRPGEVTIKIHRSTPLQGWSVANYVHLPISE